MDAVAFGQGPFLLLPIIGLLCMLYAAFRILKSQNSVRPLIMWGALADLGLIFMGMGVLNRVAFAGVTLFAIFQFCARFLALQSLNALTEGAEEKDNLTALCGAGTVKPWHGLFLAFGLLAALGGSPFFVPEGRFFLIGGLFQSNAWGSIGLACAAAAVSTLMVWLSVRAVISVCLTAPRASQTSAEPWGNPPAFLLLCAAPVVLLGLFRLPVTASIFSWFNVELAHGGGVHFAFYIFYVGAFASLLFQGKKAALRAPFGALIAALALLCASCFSDSPTAHLFILMVCLVAAVVCLYSIGYMEGDHNPTRYWFFLLLTFASLIGIVSAPDTGALYSYWELMTFASFFLVVHEDTLTAHDAALKYYVMCAGGAFLMLPGLVLLGGGATSFAAVSAVTGAMPPWVLKAALAMTLAGFAVKAGLVPLHSWLPDAHPAAPSSVSAPLSGIITKMGFFGILVVLLGHAGTAGQALQGLSGLTWLGYGLSFMGAVTLVYGEVMALRQDDIKRMLAYSTLGQIGEIALVLGLGTWLATAGAMAHMFNHAIMKDLLFLGAGALIMRAGSRKLADMRGLGHVMPWTVTCMTIGLISIMGLPPFAGFMSKFLMIQAAVDAGYVWLAALILAGSLVGAVYYTRILKTLVFEPRPMDAPEVEEAPLSMRLGMSVLAALCVLIGLAPQLLIDIVVPVASSFFTADANALSTISVFSIEWPSYVLVPVLGAVLPVFFRGKGTLSGKVTLGILLFSAALVVLFGRNLDTLSFSLALIVPLIGAVNVTYALSYMDHSQKRWRFYGAFLCMAGGLMGVASAQNLFAFFFFWEIMSSWTLYMVLVHDGTPTALREGFKYFVFNVCGAGFIFVGICILGASMPVTSAAFSFIPKLSSAASFAGLSLLAIGFVMKAAQLPFRIDWQMHPAVAPTPVSGYISSVLLKSAVFGLLKLFMLLGGSFALAGVLSMDYQRIIAVLVMWAGGITIVFGAVQAMRVNRLKLVFIYSTVSQIGYMVLAVAAGSVLGYAGGMLHVVNHIFFKDLLFLICGAIMFRAHQDSLMQLGGIGRKMPFTMLMFAIGGLSLVGVPPTSGFTSKWIIYHALMQANEPFLALLSLVGSVLTLAYVAKFLHSAFLGQPSRDIEELEDAPRLMRIPMTILGVGCIITGIFPGIALYPINAVLGEYGMETLPITLSGIESGLGAWNATGMAVMMVLAFVGAWKTVTYFVNANSREVDIHSCGLDVEESTSRMQPTSVYGGLPHALRGRKPYEEKA